MSEDVSGGSRGCVRVCVTIIDRVVMDRGFV